MGAYSFQDVVAAISGPGGIISIGSGAGNAEEGISADFHDDQNAMTVGADGYVQNSLRANKSGRLVVRLLKTSPTNALLTAMWAFQRTSAAAWGQNTIVVSDLVRGDVYTCQQCAFKRHAPNTWAKDAGVLEWEFDVGIMDPLLGIGAPEA